MARYRKGTIVRISPDMIGDEENGFLIDSKRDTQLPFKAPSGKFTVNEEVEYALVRRRVTGLGRDEHIKFAKLKKIPR